MISTRASSTIIDNTIRAAANIDGAYVGGANIHVYDSAADLYGGAYEFIPMATSQIVRCNQKKMLNDVTLMAIQTRETTDAHGGVHFEILSGEVGDNGI